MGKKRKKPPFVRRTGKAPISKKQLEAKAAETGLTKLPTIFRLIAHFLIPPFPFVCFEL